MPTKKKKDTVKKLEDRLKRAKSFFLTDYRGLTNQELEALRRILKEKKAELLVVKNTLFKLAMEKSDLDKKTHEEISKKLENPTAALLVYGETIPAVKALSDYMKEQNLPKFKLGFSEDRIVDNDIFVKLASLPSREVLLSMLAASLNFPMQKLYLALNWNLQGLVTVLENIKNKK